MGYSWEFGLGCCWSIASVDALLSARAAPSPALLPRTPLALLLGGSQLVLVDISNSYVISWVLLPRRYSYRSQTCSGSSGLSVLGSLCRSLVYNL